MDTLIEPITYVCFEPTSYCNLECSFCNRGEIMATGKVLRHISMEDWKLMLDKLEGQDIREAKFTGLGEPMLHPQIDELLAEFKRRWPDAFTILATNCQYKLRENFQESMKYIDLLYLSIDGYEESYERDRSPAKWWKLIRFLDEFNELERYDCRVTVNYVINPDNINDIASVKRRIVDEYNIEELRLNIAQDWNEDKTMIGGYTDDQINYLRNYWKDQVKGRADWAWSDCFWPKKGLYLDVDGSVKMCVMNTSTEPFGNIFTDDIDDIRNSIRWQDIVHGCRTNNPTSHCKNCSYNELKPILSAIGVNNSPTVGSE